jgi:hypothetical protein
VHPVPDRPWEKLGADICDFEGKDYIVIVDYYSKYPEVVQLKRKTAEGVINAMKSVLARHGLPDTLVADNMPFASRKLQEFANEWNFKITTSSPRYPQSNGQSEKFVGTIKDLFRKALHANKDPWMSLLDYRNTPVAGLPYSPAQLLMSRTLKDTLPRTQKQLLPAVASDGKTLLKRRQEVMKSMYDRHTRPKASPQVGDPVRIRVENERVWQPATVVAQHNAPRSFFVETEDGQVYRRNTKHINRDRSRSLPPGDIKNKEHPRRSLTPPGDSIRETGSARQQSVPVQGTNTPPRRISSRDRKDPVWKKDYHCA